MAPWDEPARRMVSQEYHLDDSVKSPRYYQLNAINRTLEQASILFLGDLSSILVYTISNSLYTGASLKRTMNSQGCDHVADG